MWETNEMKMFANKVISEEKKIIHLLCADEKVGKSYLLVNLAKALIEYFDSKVLLIDVNKRNKFNHYDLLNQYELLDNNSFEMRELTHGDVQLENQKSIENWGYDYILIDSSPINIFNRHNIHPFQFSQFDSLNILVVNKNKTKIQRLKSSFKLADQENFKINFFVLNECPEESGSFIKYHLIKDKIELVIQVLYEKMILWMRV